MSRLKTASLILGLAAAYKLIHFLLNLVIGEIWLGLSHYAFEPGLSALLEEPINFHLTRYAAMSMVSDFCLIIVVLIISQRVFSAYSLDTEDKLKTVQAEISEDVSENFQAEVIEKFGERLETIKAEILEETARNFQAKIAEILYRKASEELATIKIELLREVRGRFKADVVEDLWQKIEEKVVGQRSRRP